MRKTALAATLALALGLTLAACSSPDAASEPMSDTSSSEQTTQEQTTQEPETDASEVELNGDFTGLNDKTVAGTVTVTESELTLAGFSSDEGPDLHVYLTNGTDEAAVSAGTRVDIISYDTASQTFALDGVDVSGFTHVVIHCDKAKAVFGAAELS